MFRTVKEWLKELEWMASLYGWAKNNLGGVITFFMAVPIMSYLASLSAWMNQYGPISWAFSGVLGFLIISWGMAGMARWRLLQKQNDVLVRRTQANSQINPMDTNFHKLRINLNDLVSPIDSDITEKIVSNCELIGPQFVVLIDSHVNNNEFVNCNFIKLDNEYLKFAENENLRLTDANIIPWVRCTMTKNKIFGVTFLIYPDFVDAIEKGNRNIRWMS